MLPFPETPRVTLKPVHNIYDAIPRKDDLPPKVKQAPPKKSQPLQETQMHIEKAIDFGLLKNIEFIEKKGGDPKNLESCPLVGPKPTQTYILKIDKRTLGLLGPD